MFYTMNRFRIVPGREADFEAVWINRDSRLAELPGFVSFHLLRGDTSESHTLYVSHSVWRDEASFREWTRSAQFRTAHKDAGDTRGMYLGPPDFESFTPVEGA